MVVYASVHTCIRDGHMYACIYTCAYAYVTICAYIHTQTIACTCTLTCMNICMYNVYPYIAVNGIRTDILGRQVVLHTQRNSVLPRACVQRYLIQGARFSISLQTGHVHQLMPLVLEKGIPGARHETIDDTKVKGRPSSLGN